MELSRDLREFIELLNSHRVEFLIVGAHALAWYGLPRYTKDIDIFVRVSDENAEALAETIKDFGFGSTGLSNSDFLEADQIIQLGMEPHRIDILTGISGVTWMEAWESREKGTIENVEVFYVGKSVYIKNKLASGRPQDITDVTRLREIEES
ncbi:MAG: nucleotidyltransferase [Verrucomicrobiota bacterium]